MSALEHVADETAGWTHARDELLDLVGDLVVIEDYCRRVLAGEQDTTPERALEYIKSAAAEALSRVTTVDTNARGEGK